MKYEFTGETRVEFYVGRLRRIRRISDGLVGGWIESNKNLSQFGKCFVYDQAMVYGNALVCGNSSVYDSSRVCDRAVVCDEAMICGNSRICENAQVSSRGLTLGAWLFGEMKATREVIQIKGFLQHGITASDEHIEFSGEIHTTNHWNSHCEEILRNKGYRECDIAEFIDCVALISKKRSEKK